MSIKENKSLIRHVYELLNRREMDTSYELYAPGNVAHFTTGDMSLTQTREFEAMFVTAFPDISFTIEDMVAEGDRVAVRVTSKGTHKGEFMGIAPTGNKIEMTNTSIYGIADGKLAEYWGTVDTLRLMQQLGAIPKQ